MKQFFALAVSCLAVAAVAQPVAHQANLDKLESLAPVMRFDSKAPAQLMEVNTRMDRAYTEEASSLRKAPASTSAGALYRPSSHSLKMGLFYYEDYNAWGYSYRTPMLFSQAYKGTYDKVVGSSWTIGTADNAVEAEDLDEEGNYDMGNAGMGVGGYYTPKIWSKSGASYYYGSDDSDAGSSFTYSVNYKGDAESMALGAYQIYGDMNLYSGYTNTLAYGAREYDNAKGQLCQSDMLYIEYGDLGGGFVLQSLELPIITQEDGTPYFENGDMVTATIYDKDEETGITKEYSTTFGADDVELDTNGNALIHATFTEVDEDGFETEVEPVLNGYVTLVMTGFRQAGVHCGFRMVWDNTADDDSRSGGDFGSTHSYFDMWTDGVQAVDETGAPQLYYTDCTEAVLSLVGYYNTLCMYGTGETYVNAEIPVEGGWAVSQYGEDGTGYNDFDVASSLSLEDIEAIKCPEWVAMDYDTQYFEDYGLIAFFFGADALPEGTTGLDGEVILQSGGNVTMTFHLTQGEVPEGIQTISADQRKGVKVYNVVGQKLVAKSGLVIEDGAVKFIKK